MSGRPAYLLTDEVIFDDLSVIVSDSSRPKKKTEFKYRLRYEGSQGNRKISICNRCI